MGCWNGTCSISNLAITAGTKVKVIVIKNNVNFPDATAFVYDGGYASPMSFCIDAEYNDYGSVENIKDNKAMKLFREWFIANLDAGNIKIKEDSHSKFDAQNSKNEDIFEVMERGYVEYNTTYFSWDEETQNGCNKKAWVNLGFSMIHEDIFNSVQSAMSGGMSYELKDFNQSNLKKDCTYAVEDFFLQDNSGLTEDELNEKYEELSNLDETPEIKAEKLVLRGHLRKLWSSHDSWDTDCRKIGSYSNVVRMLNGNEGANMRIFQHYFNELKTMTIEEKDDVVNMLMDIISVIRMMNSLRVPWQSQTGAGSQSFDEEAYLGLAEGIKKVVYDSRIDMEDGSLYCSEDWTQTASGIEFKEDGEYKVIKTDWNNNRVIIDVNGAEAFITYNEYQSHFEY